MPITATTAAYLALAASAVGAVGSIATGAAQAKQAKMQAAIQRQQAERERLIAQRDEEDFRRRQSAAAARVRAAGGARGVDISTGSPLLASEDFAREVEVQSGRILEGGEVRGTRLEQQAALTEAKGRSAFTGGLFSAGGSLLSGASRSALILNDKRYG